jgi:cell wall-associated NlpC family hydrolase
MTFQRMKCVLLLAAMVLPCLSASAAPMLETDLHDWQLERSSPVASFALPSSGTFMPGDSTPDIAPAAVTPPPATGLRKVLADFAMTLRNIRYRRGGREPSTGFDCSGFVRYVYQHTLGKELPADSASQYLAGTKVDRAEMKMGDLVFFRIRGKNVSHVGIYLGDGRFIHSPSSGKRVSVSELSEAYWAKRFVGAKRPNVLS